MLVLPLFIPCQNENRNWAPISASPVFRLEMRAPRLGVEEGVLTRKAQDKSPRRKAFAVKLQGFNKRTDLKLTILGVLISKCDLSAFATP